MGSFQARKGWFHCFQTHYKIHNICRTGESCLADKEGAEHYLPQFEEIITIGGYWPEQGFNEET